MMAASCSPRKGYMPVNISNSTTPKEKMSERASVSPPWICSGAMYEIVPTVVEVFVSLTEPRSLASPKSMTFARPADVSMMLSDLMSLCTIPFECASRRASPAWIAMPRASSISLIGSFPRRVPPSICSMTMNINPSCSSMPCTVHTFGWFRCAAAFASWRNLPRSASDISVADGMNFSATSRSSLVSRAL